MTERLMQLNYNAALIGTGLSSSVLAASLSLEGRSVLHLDPYPFYGGISATLPLCEWEALIKRNAGLIDKLASLDDGPTIEEKNLPKDIDEQLLKRFGEGAKFIELTLKQSEKALFPFGIRILCKNISDAEKRCTYLDLEPRALYAAGKMVELLEKTNVGHYVTFKALDAIYVESEEDGLQQVPASRSDLFQNKYVTMIEKRLMMRFLKQMDDDNGADESEKNKGADFEQYMDQARLTEKLKIMIRHTIAFTAEQGSVSEKEARARVKLYAQSLARFGTPTPFLWTNYGVGDLTQAFCRLCAVNGGTYVLGRSIKGIIHQNGKQIGFVTSENEIIRSETSFIESSLLVDKDEAEASKVWHLAVVTDRSVVPEKDRVMIVVPKGSSDNARSTVHIYQLDHSLMLCPKGRYVLYAHTNKDGTESDLLAVLRKYILFGDEQTKERETRAQAMWAVLYARKCGTPNKEERYTNGLQIVQNEFTDWTCQQSIDEAERCSQMCREKSSSGALFSDEGDREYREMMR